MEQMKKVRVRKSFWLGSDGCADVDEGVITEVDKIAVDDKMAPLIHAWRQLKGRIQKARYDGFGAYAYFSRRPKKTELILSVMFFHPGPDDNTPLPDEQVASIKNRARRIAAIVRAQGFEVEDDDPEAKEFSQFWVTLPDVGPFEKVLDEFVRLSIEFGLEEYLWEWRE